MRHHRPSATVLAAALLTATGVVLAATAWADAPNGGTPAGQTPFAQDSGGVAGPPPKRRAHAAQQPAQEPPTVVPPPTDTTPSDDTGEEPTTPAPEEPSAAPAPGSQSAPASSGGGGGGGVSLPHTGLELAALAAVGLGLLLAGLALRRGPEST